MGLEAEEKEKEGVRVVQPHLTGQVTPTITFLELRGITISLTLFIPYFVCLKKKGGSSLTTHACLLYFGGAVMKLASVLRTLLRHLI